MNALFRIFNVSTAIDPVGKFLGDWSHDISNIITILLRLFITILCAGAIGVERARKRHAAGFRTYMLVSLGATMIMMVNEFLINVYGEGDPARLAAQVISGIGFLGAGSIIITSKNQVKGLTTAAGLWTAACIGIAIGSGFYTLALSSTIIIVIILSFMPRIERFLRRKTRYFELYVELETRQNLKDLVNYLRSIDVTIDTIEKNPAYINSGLSVYSIMLCTKEKIERECFLAKIHSLEYVNHCEEMNK